MKKTIKILLLCFTVLLLFCSSCMANDVMPITEDDDVVDETTTTNEATTEVSVLRNDIYLFDTDIVMADLVDGNAFIYGSNVTITGEIAGDLFVMAENLTIDSTAIIYGNVFAIASQMSVKGQMTDIYAFSENFILDSTCYIARDIKVYSTNITLDGFIAKDAYIATNGITFAENAEYIIGNNLNYTSSSELTIPDNIVGGEVKFNPVAEESVPTVKEVISNYIITFANVLIYAIFVILIVVFFAPKFTDKASYCMSKKPFATAGIGILAIIIVPILSIVLLFTGFLTYASIALLTVYFLVLSMTVSILGIAIGNYFSNKLKTKSKGKTIGLSIAAVAVLWLLQQIPAIGGYISLFTIVFGLGVFVYAFFMKKDVTKLEE